MFCIKESIGVEIIYFSTHTHTHTHATQTPQFFFLNLGKKLNAFKWLFSVSTYVDTNTCVPFVCTAFAQHAYDVQPGVFTPFQLTSPR